MTPGDELAQKDVEVGKVGNRVQMEGEFDPALDGVGSKLDFLVFLSHGFDDGGAAVIVCQLSGILDLLDPIMPVYKFLKSR